MKKKSINIWILKKDMVDIQLVKQCPAHLTALHTIHQRANNSVKSQTNMDIQQ